MKPPRVCLDTSCLIAAALSDTGGSSKILGLAAQRRLTLVLSEEIIRETQKNILEEPDIRGHLDRLNRRLVKAGCVIVPAATLEDLAEWETLTDPKDVHILATAAKGKAEALVTLDRRHLLTDKVSRGFPIPVMDTRDFFLKFWPGHDPRPKN